MAATRVVTRLCTRCNVERDHSRLGQWVARYEWVMCRTCGVYSLDPEPRSEPVMT